ncbi:MAG: four helix bundle protein [Calditrichaeota bacterium]|nr:four helix bundle protein [Calditrichota bacterium]
MNKGFRHLEDIEVWKRACRLVVRIYELADSGVLSKHYSLKDQMVRSAVSIPSNIAEGYERDSNAEFRRFLLIAKGSCGELRTQLYILKATKIVEGTNVDSLIGECMEISSMLKGLSTQIAARNVRS